MRILFVFIFLNMLSNGFVLGQETKYDKMLKSQYRNTVPLMYNDGVSQSISSGKGIVILDTRENIEFNVSHIKTARYAGYNDFKLESVSDISKETTIIVYCSIGWRSERIGEQLIQAGYKNVYNLYGGIFGWFNEGFPVYNSKNEKMDLVHPYDDSWGKWLKKR